MVLIIADDLTGATDTGIQLQKQGIPTTVLVGPPEKPLLYPGVEAALSINASSRELGAEDAARRTREVMRQISLRNEDTVFKKVDSLMRGNPAEELEAVLKVTGRRHALAAPSYPEMGRTVTDGVLHLPDGTEKDLLALFKSRCDSAVCHIPLARLRAEGMALATSINREKKALVWLFDAVTEEDLALVTRIGQALEERPVYCGSAALAAALPVSGQNARVDKPPRAGSVLMVTGSRKRETARQVQRLQECCGLHTVLMDSGLLLQGDDAAEIPETVQKLTGLLTQEHGAILAFDSLFCSQTGFEDDDVAARQSGKRLARELGEVLTRLDPALYDGLILVGGDTSVEVCRSLHTTQIRLLEEVQSGTPAGLLADGPLRGMPVITKSGAFGDEDTLLHTWKYIRRENG